MNEEVWPGMGDRIRQRIKDLGYASVEKFTQAHPKSGYSLGLVYKWIREEVAPSRANVLRLAADLDCEPAYLFFGTPVPTEVRGRRRPAPISGGSAASSLPAVDQPGVDARATTPQEGKKSIKSRAYRDIMSTTARGMVRRLHRPVLGGAETRWALAA